MQYENEEFVGYIFLHPDLSKTEIELVSEQFKRMNTSSHPAEIIKTMAGRPAIYGSFPIDFIQNLPALFFITDIQPDSVCTPQKV
jgi:hypothetical protein